MPEMSGLWPGYANDSVLTTTVSLSGSLVSFSGPTAAMLTPPVGSAGACSLDWAPMLCTSVRVSVIQI